MRSSGHRGVPHTADLRVEAWAPTREECLAQAVRAVCESFLDLTGAVGVRDTDVVVRGERDEDVLVALLEEILYRLDTAGEIPVEVTPVAVADGVRVGLRMADVAALPLTGAVPKAVTLHRLDFRPGPEGWTCAVTLDV
ncbi:archease [Streptomyces sp. NPDC052051]|uniref:archease n=1 Tax=Streptomyces sp. NPDC052051 TaxID=3154649 RepID=UPI003428D698